MFEFETQIFKPEADSIIGKFLEVTKSMSPEERASHLEKDESFGATHEDFAQQGQTEVCQNYKYTLVYTSNQMNSRLV